jgi:hypothetical protein
MPGDERRRRELARLAAEILADAEVLDGVVQAVVGARPRLRAPDRAVLAMVAVDLHRWFTAVENVVERAERLVGALPAAGPSWHKDLLQGATLELPQVRPAILPARLLGDLEALLAFRHSFRHAYAVEFDAARLDDLAGRLERAHAPLAADHRGFATWLDGMAATLEG